MYNKNIPSDLELPSSEKLIRSTILAALAAIVLLVTAVLPAEYGIDPTGIGRILGLKKMGDIKVSLAEEAAADRDKDKAVSEQSVTSIEAEITMPAPPPAPTEPVVNLLSHEMHVTLGPNEGTEIKVVLAKGKNVHYTWWTDGGRVNFDVHGDSKELDIDYHNYSKGSKQKSEGDIEAAFDGNHGWFWRNRTSKMITITLQTEGEYTDIKHLE